MNDIGHALQCNPADGNDWFPTAGRPSEEIEAASRITRILRRGVEDGAYGHVSRVLPDRPINLAVVVRREADDRRARKDLPHGPDGQIVLADMDAIRPAQSRDICPIVDDDDCPGRSTPGHERIGEAEKRAAPALLLSKLEHARASRRAGVEQGQRIDTPLAAQGRVDDGIQEWLGGELGAQTVNVQTMHRGRSGR